MNSSFSFQVLFTSVFLVLLTVHTNFQPYEKRRANIMESFYLMVLCILAFVQSVEFEDTTVKDYICSGLVILASLLALVVFLCKAVGFFRRRFNCSTVCVRENGLDRSDVEEIENTPTNSSVFTQGDSERQLRICDSFQETRDWVSCSSDTSSFFKTD